ncbi:MAG TPA: AAA family ATPase, partial [Kofleriaceae bacterium]
FLHARRLLHRDLAPRNVRCTSTGQAKLIDFGVLATTGMAGDIAGTPPLVAPEALHGRPLDHRYDLYGLGALAYKILTKRHAYPARSIETLEDTWRTKPVEPSTLAPGIPRALDELVMALLARDPLARPASAAEVIDRLTTIGDLEPLGDVETSRGWIASAALIGRQHEVGQIRRAAARAYAGEGRTLVIEAPSGTGKTRMLREVALEAQLVGMTVIRADSDAANRGPYGIVHELARGLFAVIPDAANRAAAGRAPLLARVIASLRERVKPAPPLGDPAEDRMQLQNEVAAFFLDVASTHSIALVIDDIQRCDEASAAVIATLAYQAEDKHLLLAAALRSDEAVRARAPLAALADIAHRLRLRGLDADEVTELCRSLFGDIEHIPRLAHWMHKTAGGSPLYTTELARHLVERGVLRYEHGLWTVPDELGHEDLPRGLADAMDARVRALPATARALGEALSIHGGDLTLELVLLLADSADEGMVFAALDHLAYEEVLLFNGNTWRFRHDGLREALLRGLDDDRRRALHRRVGDALAAAPDRSAERDAEIGWHLLRGGDREHGAKLLEAAGRALYDAQSFSDCIPPLEAALEVRTETKSSARMRLELLAMLVMSGTLTDRKVALRHNDACMEGFRYWAGIDVMVKVRRYVGRHLAVAVGLSWALLRWLFTPRRGPNPYEAFRTYFVTVAYVTSVYSLMFDMANVQKMLRAVDPIAIFQRRVPYAVYLLTRNLHDYPCGEVGAVRRQSQQILSILDGDRLTPIRDIDRRAFAGAARYMLALVAVSEVEPTWTREVEQLANVHMRFYDIGAENVRAIYHRMRGEEEAALEIEARVEQLYVQLGSVWQMEAFMPIVASLAYAFSRDTLGLRRTIDRLSRQISQGFHFTPYLELARGEYLREHGDLEEARAAIQASMATDLALVRVAALPALAETLLALGELDRACDVARDGIALGSDPEHGNSHGKLRSIRALALAEAARGEVDAAARRLDAALAEAKPRSSPLLSGTLHEARARVALACDDWPAYHLHRAETEQHYRATRNPVLIAHAERLAQLATRAAAQVPAAGGDVATAALRKPDPVSVVSDVVTTPTPSDVDSWVSSKLAGCRGSAERAQRLLDLVIHEAHGEAGYLFARTRGGCVLAAPSWGEEPPAELVERVEVFFEATQTLTENLRREAKGWKLIPLAVRGAGNEPIGCVAIALGIVRLVDPDAELLHEIARRLRDSIEERQSTGSA